uniref:protein-histidine N-methyltransferase n=1 Tax=Globodera rostochiensis TaxID=31243 RepID=A0A914HF26_GLORO
MLKLANCNLPEPKNRLGQLTSFLEWCKKMQIQHSALEILSSPHGLCLTSKEPLECGIIAAKVPLSATFSTDIAFAANVDSLKKILVEDELIQSMENVALAMSVAHEVLRGSESEWAPYFNMLPSTFFTPIFYTEEQFQALKPSPVFEESLRMFRAVARQFVYFYLRILGDNGKKSRKCLSDTSRIFAGSPFTAHNFTFDFYRWCVSAVSTRINMVPICHLNHFPTNSYKCVLTVGLFHIPALIPFIDMANHAHSLENSGSLYFEYETNSINIQLNKCVEVGQELCIHYGPRNNSKFLLHNGFVPQFPNPDDFFELKIGLPRSTSDFEIKLQHLTTISILPINNQSHQNIVYTFQLKMNPSVGSIKQSALWTFAKIFVADDNLVNFETGENDQRAKKFITDRFKLLIHGYKTKAAKFVRMFNKRHPKAERRRNCTTPMSFGVF